MNFIPMNQKKTKNIKRLVLITVLWGSAFSIQAGSCEDETIGIVLAKQMDPPALSLLFDEGSEGKCTSSVSESVTKGGGWQMLEEGDGAKIRVNEAVITSLRTVSLRDIPAAVLRAFSQSSE